jgi:hypothetical protein
MTESITHPTKIKIPSWVVWVQCIAFVVLYAVWILPEIVGFRNTALVVGALFGAYSIYQYRESFLQKAAIPIWLIVALFVWATFHLAFIGPNFSLQYIEYYRIWKYAAISAVMGVGLGLALINVSVQKSDRFWYVIYFGLATPLIIYLFKYGLTSYGHLHGLALPISLQIYDPSIAIEVANRFYIPKTDYVAFCLPTMAIALGFLVQLSKIQDRWKLPDFLSLAVQTLIIVGTLFLFSIQNIKNGMVYAFMLFVIFGAFYFSGQISRLTWKKISTVFLVFIVIAVAIVFNVQKNDSWRTLVADTKVGFQLEKYPNWKDASKYGYPINEFGTQVSPTNYERSAWAYVGLKLSLENPMGYGLIEDSFAKMGKARWPDVGANLSHSHSGWLDIILAVGFPGFFCILGALVCALGLSGTVFDPWRSLIFWSLVANLLLWLTTEVSATVSFALLIFWICLACGLTLIRSNPKMPLE